MTRLDDLETILCKVILEMEKFEATWINYFALDHGCIQLHFHIHFHVLMCALQAAHLRCLSVNLLDSPQLCQIFNAAAHKAKAYHYQLML